MSEPKPTDLFSILPDEEKRKIVREVYKRHAEAMAADAVRCEVLRCAQDLAPELAKVAVEAFAREFRCSPGFGSRSDVWSDVVRKAIRDGIEAFLLKHTVTLTPK